jgi:signal transduction histidine kinase
MRRRRLPIGILLPIALLVLVGSLAGLQWKWLGSVSQAERDELRVSLDRRAREFATDFDRELSRTYFAFQTAGERADPSAPEPFAARLDGWRSAAMYPGLVKAVYLARERESSGQFELFFYSPESRTFQPATWPESLATVQRHVQLAAGRFPTTLPSGAQVVALSSSSMLADVPAFVVPAHPRPYEAVMQATEKAAVEANARRMRETQQVRGSAFGRATVPDATFEVLRVRVDHSFLVVHLDAALIRDTIVPSLVRKHFPDSERYRVAIVDASNRPIHTRNLPTKTIAAEAADVVAPFFRVRSEVLVETAAGSWTTPAGAGGSVTLRSEPLVESQFAVVLGRGGSGGAAGTLSSAPPARAATARPAGWRVLVQHAAGSLEAAVQQTRVRNLWLSFGILAALAVSVGLIVLNARRSERLAAQQMDFVATVSHELRTPLAVIRSAAQNLSAGVVHEAEQARRYGDLIENEGRRLTDMVEQVLEYAGLSGHRGPRLERVEDVGAIVRDTMSSCAALFEADGFVVELDVAPDLPPVLADGEAIRRALNNLISNALKYGADGRWVAVSARKAGAKGREEVQIAVSDRGLGIEAQDLTHLFEPFYRGRRAVERQIHGNGLGLSLVKRIAESHGGRITVKSAPGEGATFVLHLPAAPPEAVAAVPEPAAESGARLA